MTEEIKELRMYLLMRIDIEIPYGKGLGQAGHAFSTALLHHSRKYPDEVEKYYDDNQPKIVLRCNNLDALLRAQSETDAAGLNYFTVTDAGRTVFPEPTITCMAIGPCYREDLPKFIQRMRLY